MTEPLISICIPTWNRRYALKDSLQSIVNQKSFLDKRVEIVICDNNSDDETKVEVKRLCDVYDNIHFYENPENIWPMPNVKKVMSLWNWKYILALWSDDYIHPNGLNELLNIIGSKSPDIIIIWNSFNEKKDKIKNFENLTSFFDYLWNCYKTWENFRDLQSRITRVSSCCIKKSLYDKNLKDACREYWNQFLDDFSFQHALIWYLFDIKKIISFNKEIISPLRIKYENTEMAHNTWRAPSFKIINDFDWIFKFLINKYKLNKNFHKLYYRCKLKRLFWYFFWKIIYILYPTMRKLLPNKVIKYIYKKLWDKVED